MHVPALRLAAVAGITLLTAGCNAGATANAPFPQPPGAATAMRHLRPDVTASVLYNFQLATGGNPTNVMGGPNKTFLGIAASGGAFGGGVVYQLVPAGNAYTENVVYDFRGGADGAYPVGGLVPATGGAYYGVTLNGGNVKGPCGTNGCGTVFKLTPSASGYTEGVVYAFKGGSDGMSPGASLTNGGNAAGPFYGVTYAGGGGNAKCGAGCGTVFKLTVTASGASESVIHAFSGSGSQGWSPEGSARLIGGKLIGTTFYGGTAGFGTVYSLLGKRFETIYSFRGGTIDGANPVGQIAQDANGDLFGTTTSGGSLANCHYSARRGCGIVFELSPNGAGYTESVLHKFLGGDEGAVPESSVEFYGSTGAIYGTTAYGGGRCDAGGRGCGTVYERVKFGGGYRSLVLADFQDATKGSNPIGGLAIANDGHTIFGVTHLGGSASYGTFYKLTLQ